MCEFAVIKVKDCTFTLSNFYADFVLHTLYITSNYCGTTSCYELLPYLVTSSVNLVRRLISLHCGTMPGLK